MVKDCPRCRLVNPPSAQRCDCGYEFATGRVEQTYLSDADVERSADARNPVYYVPGGTATTLGMLAITGINGPGACLTGMAVMLTVLIGAIAAGPTWVYVLTFGLGAVALDFVGRRFLNCGPLDTKRGSRFLAVPVWVLGAIASFIGTVLLLANKF